MLPKELLRSCTPSPEEELGCSEKDGAGGGFLHRLPQRPRWLLGPWRVAGELGDRAGPAPKQTASRMGAPSAVLVGAGSTGTLWGPANPRVLLRGAAAICHQPLISHLQGREGACGFRSVLQRAGNFFFFSWLSRICLLAAPVSAPWEGRAPWGCSAGRCAGVLRCCPLLPAAAGRNSGADEISACCQGETHPQINSQLHTRPLAAL